MPILKGTLDPLVLKTLSWAPMHAFEIARWLEERSAHFTIEDAALMQALHRLETRRLVSADWGVTENGRRARYYQLTEAGRAHLRAETKRLTEYTSALTAVLAARSARS
ncbi:MAG TPA: helix-turn-helix transcriptional regulator [Gemmatimonadaceae bacterium]|nr:helix-turn-helix transcriptional regulator [Gemmatimonadaceae bacterium]